VVRLELPKPKLVRMGGFSGTVAVLIGAISLGRRNGFLVAVELHLSLTTIPSGKLAVLAGQGGINICGPTHRLHGPALR
jgi:hypothetical protein